jgi:hypothetical protein
LSTSVDGETVGQFPVPAMLTDSVRASCALIVTVCGVPAAACAAVNVMLDGDALRSDGLPPSWCESWSAAARALERTLSDAPDGASGDDGTVELTAPPPPHADSIDATARTANGRSDES